MNSENKMRTVVVTGAASGMGRACVERIRDLGDVVFAVDVRAPEIEGTVGIACDITDARAVAQLASQVAGAGTFRALVHAAGISPTMADARRVLEVNLVGTQLLLNVFGPLVEPGSAAVCFASTAAHQVAPFMNPEWEALLADPLAVDFLDRAVAVTSGDSGFGYGLSKVGVMRAVSRAANPWGRRGGRVNSVSPGIIDTPMGRLELEHQPAMQQMLADTPLSRLGQADEVAAVAAFLVSDGASFVNGIDVLVDGGYIRAGSPKAS